MKKVSALHAGLLACTLTLLAPAVIAQTPDQSPATANTVVDRDDDDGDKGLWGLAGLLGLLGLIRRKHHDTTVHHDTTTRRTP